MKEEVDSSEISLDLLILRRIARIYSAILLAIILFITTPEYLSSIKKGVSWIEPIASIINGGHILLFLPWVFVVVGFVIAFWKEGLGGGVSLISFIAVFLTLGAGSWVILVVCLCSVPSILYLIYWWKVFHKKRK